MTRLVIRAADVALLLDPWRAFELATGLAPLAWQRPYLLEDRDTLLKKGRQVGASTAAGVISCRYARLVPGSLVAIVSPSQKQSTEVKERTRKSALALGFVLDRDSETELRFDNRSRVLSLPGTPKAVRGWSADLLVIDEAAYLDPETFLAARATVAATGGRVIVQSTPTRAPFGHFYDLWHESGERWARYHITSEEAGSISSEFLASERATMTAEEYASEYGGEFGTLGVGLVDPARLAELTVAPTSPSERDLWTTLRGSS